MIHMDDAPKKAMINTIAFQIGLRPAKIEIPNANAHTKIDVVFIFYLVLI